MTARTMPIRSALPSGIVLIGRYRSANGRRQRRSAFADTGCSVGQIVRSTRRLIG